MTTERFGLVKFRGQEVTVLGEDLKPGDPAPDFVVQTLALNRAVPPCWTRPVRL